MLHNHLAGSAVASISSALTGSVVIAMTESSVALIVSGIANSVLGVATLYFAYKAKAISTDTGKAVNGKMEEFKKMAEDFYHAKGVADEKLSAEAKAGLQAAAKAEGKAEAKAEVKAPPNGRPH